jgi:hypothetical protein
MAQYNLGPASAPSKRRATHHDNRTVEIRKPSSRVSKDLPPSKRLKYLTVEIRKTRGGGDGSIKLVKPRGPRELEELKSLQAVPVSTVTIKSNGPPKTLLGMPAEIRRSIWAYVFETDLHSIMLPFATVKSKKLVARQYDFSKYHSHGQHSSATVLGRSAPKLNLSILATNKKLSKECAEFFWNNTFYGYTPFVLKDLILTSGPASYIFDNVQHLSLSVDILGSVVSQSTKDCYALFEFLADNHNLKSVTFAASPDSESFSRAYKNGVRGRYSNWLYEIKKVRNGPLAKLQLKFMFYSGWSKLSQKEQQLKTRRLPNCPVAFTDQMHDCIGGELWIDDVLCYRDGVRLVVPYDIVLGEGESMTKLPVWARERIARA